MSWVKPFYRLQRGLLPPPDATLQQERLRMVTNSGAAPGARLLDLGAGTGDFASAAARAGYEVTAVELVPELADDARATVAPAGGRVLCGDFYELALPETFEVVCYWDGFGLGSDADQARLLGRIAAWMTPAAVGLVEVYTPWYWAEVAGQVIEFEAATRRYGFDSHGRRMLDTWTPKAAGRARTQSLRCYAPFDLAPLLSSAGLGLRAVHPGGALDHHSGTWRANVPLQEAMTFVAVLEQLGHQR